MGLTSEIITGVISPITNVVGGYLNKKQDIDLEKFKVDGQVDMKLVEGYIALIQANASLLSNKWMVRLQIVFGSYLSLYYGKCIVWDKVFQSWTHGHTDPLTGDIATYSLWIMGFLFLHSTLSNWTRKT